MKINKITLVVCCIVAMFGACKKDDTTGGGTTTTTECQVKKATLLGGIGEVFYEYDSQKRLSREISNFFGSDTTNYSYGANQIIARKKGPFSDLQTDTATLNSSGYIVKLRGTSDSEDYTYNSDGYLTRLTRQDGSYSLYAYANGNRVQEKQYSATNVLNETITLEYTTDIGIGNSVMNGSNAAFKQGKDSGKLPSKVTDSTSVTTFKNIVKNAKGYPTSFTASSTDISDNSVTEFNFSFEYNCP